MQKATEQKRLGSTTRRLLASQGGARDCCAAPTEERPVPESDNAGNQDNDNEFTNEKHFTEYKPVRSLVNEEMEAQNTEIIEPDHKPNNGQVQP